jgi:hypothetical protein
VNCGIARLQPQRLVVVRDGLSIFPRRAIGESAKPVRAGNILAEEATGDDGLGACSNSGLSLAGSRAFPRIRAWVSAGYSSNSQQTRQHDGLIHLRSTLVRQQQAPIMMRHLMRIRNWGAANLSDAVALR